MKIYKIAQGIPPGSVVVEFRINKKTRELTKKIVAHGPNTGCHVEDDAALLDDMFGGKLEREGVTTEHKKEKKTKERVTPHEEEESGPFGKPGFGQREEGKKLDMGFGV